MTASVKKNRPYLLTFIKINEHLYLCTFSMVTLLLENELCILKIMGSELMHV